MGDIADLQIAIAYEFYQGLGNAVDMRTKEAALASFLCEVGLMHDGKTKCSDFIELIGPALLANLPDAQKKVRFSKVNADEQLQIKLHVPLSGEVVTLRESAELPKDGGTVGDLR